MRIGCLQFAPQVGDVNNNLNRADAVLSRANPEGLDLLVLPELCFSGYNFKSLQHIASYLEPSGSGITSLWSRTTALKYNCLVAAGYPEKVDPTVKWPTDPEYYNSVIIVNGEGETVANYRKSFLYYTDETWALEGKEGFFEGYIPGLGHTSMGICMDLNPYKFEAPWHAFEFASHIVEYGSNLVVVSMAWMTREDAGMFSRTPNEPDMDTLTYWITRLEPLIRAEKDEEVIVVFCNRTGIEDDAVYAGTSAVVGIQDGEVRVYGVLGRGDKELLVVDTERRPYAKLVSRPGAFGSVPAHGELQKSNKSPTADSSHADTPRNASEGDDQSGSPSLASQPSSTQHVSTKSQSPEISASRKRDQQLPSIQIPSHSAQTNQCSSAQTLKSPGSDITTPSAPSPTLHAVRPRLVIPQSPPSSISQASSPPPTSTQSTYSARSLHSISSNQSVASNERPPAESTPYPDSGIPLSGYPRPTQVGATLQGGRSRSSQEEAVSPVNPF